MGRECGGFKAIDWNTKCFDYTPSEHFPTLEEWYESFPHVYMVFEPNATIPLFPRDYFFLENGKQCMGFAYLDGRIILGALFMRNFDVQFDRDNLLVKMVRADCSQEKIPEFRSFYFNHQDARYDPANMLKSTVDQKTTEKQEYTPSGLLVFAVSAALIIAILIYSVYCRRYQNTDSNSHEFVRAEKIDYEL